MKEELYSIIQLLQQLYAMDISLYTDEFLILSLQRRMRDTSAASPAAYQRLLQNNWEEAETFARMLHVTYSQFFRDDVNYTLLEQIVIPALASQKAAASEVRVWSAGCAEGQEAYSIAILLAEYNRLYSRNLRFRIFATDIVTQALDTGRAGLYTGAAVENVKAAHLQRYFIQQGGAYTVIPQLQQHVEFLPYDLLDPSTKIPPDSIYGDFDIILCSNVSIYYKEEHRRTILHKLRNALAADGYLVTSIAESSPMEAELRLPPLTSATGVFHNSKRSRLS